MIFICYNKFMMAELKTRTRIAGIVIENGKLLLLKGKGYEELWTPGGKIDGEETDEECLEREFKEEIGVEIEDSKFMYLKDYTGESAYLPNTVLVQRIYLVKIKGEIKPDHEIEGYVWLSKEDFKNNKYKILPIDREKVLPDLINSKIW